jgi:hypothetical protein
MKKGMKDEQDWQRGGFEGWNKMKKKQNNKNDRKESINIL